MKRLIRFKYELLFFTFFVVLRLPFMGTESFNTDVWKWKARIYDFGSGVFTLDFEKTLQKYHPGVTLMWTGSLAVKMESLYCAAFSCPSESGNALGAVFRLDTFQKATLTILIGLILTFSFYPLRELFGKKLAFISTFILSMEPFYYGISRQIHLEGLLTACMVASLIWLFFFFHDHKKYKLMLSAVFAALAALTKSPALILGILSVGALFLISDLSIKKRFRYSILWVLVFVGFYFLLWPSMWVQPLKTLEYVFIRGVMETGVEGGHEQIYFGNYTNDPGPFYYLVVFALKTSPLLLFGVIGFLLMYKKILTRFTLDRARQFIILCLVFGLSYLIEITIPSKKLDRYVLPTISYLALLSGFFYTWVMFTVIPNSVRSIKLFRATNTKLLHILPLAITGVFFVGYSFQILSISPDYLSYYNPMFGGLEKGIRILEPKWLIGERQITEYFSGKLTTEKLLPFSQGESLENQKDLSQRLTVAFPEKYYTQIWPFIQRIGGWAVIEDLTPQARTTRYFVYPVWDDYADNETRFKLTYIESIYLRGVKVYNIYERSSN